MSQEEKQEADKDRTDRAVNIDEAGNAPLWEFPALHRERRVTTHIRTAPLCDECGFNHDVEFNCPHTNCP